MKWAQSEASRSPGRRMPGVPFQALTQRLHKPEHGPSLRLGPRAPGKPLPSPGPSGGSGDQGGQDQVLLAFNHTGGDEGEEVRWEKDLFQQELDVVALEF